MTAALMMAAMMLPGALPATLRRAGVDARAVFAASYFALWTLVGIALAALNQPGATIAGVVTIAAGVYELTPLKRECRRRCQEYTRSGVEFGIWCVGASVGLMAMVVAIGAMNAAWMAVVAALVLAQKVLPPRAAIDIPLAIAIVVLGVLIVVAPDSVPGVMPAAMSM
jgi:predicted metal-binding membrane protein